MRSFTSLPLLAFVFASVSTLVGAAAVDDQCRAEMCMGGQNEVARALPADPVVNVAREPLTNAERLSRGLPPKAPTRRFHAARTQASPSPQNSFTGKIEVRNTDGGAVLGWLSTATSDAGNIKPTTNEGEAMKFTFTLDFGATSGSQVRVNMQNSPGPLLGLVEGRDNANPDIGADSFQYMYLNGISLPGSSPGSSPTAQTSVYSTKNSVTKHAETDIWTIDTVSGAMSVQWINSDGSAPATYLFLQSNYVYAGGSPSKFHDRYPAPVTTVSFKFVADA
ncbi:hypothetical protein D9619_002172 [Psilocybe cf. subviscida]|uniref:Uncharacterized protein n=1 Tax=Psilocybe cf. subviscida TaxID=2480587 RepID=A0A8H5BCH4_9AGAR|nr:hypothetical protein D9619_002172 [Psilocybe cf. subviscida]